MRSMRPTKSGFSNSSRLLRRRCMGLVTATCSCCTIPRSNPSLVCLRASVKLRIRRAPSGDIPDAADSPFLHAPIWFTMRDSRGEERGCGHTPSRKMTVEEHDSSTVRRPRRTPSLKETKWKKWKTPRIHSVVQSTLSALPALSASAAPARRLEAQRLSKCPTSTTTAVIARAKKTMPAMASRISQSRDSHHAFRDSCSASGTGSRRMRDGRAAGRCSSTVFLPGFHGLLMPALLGRPGYRRVSRAKKILPYGTLPCCVSPH